MAVNRNEEGAAKSIETGYFMALQFDEKMLTN
jgi:hypothetical protein